MEIDKAIRAEEWGIPVEAVNHYEAAQLILVEGLSIPVSYSEGANIYQEKMLKWQTEVTERLRVLSNRSDLHLKDADVRQNLPKKPLRSWSSGTMTRPSRPITPFKSGRIPAPKPGLCGSSSSADGRGSVRNQASVLKGIDPKLAEIIEKEILDRTPAVSWDSIAGLEKAKQTLMEMVILPIRRRDLFTGLRKPARGLLLFGPPGNGKTLLGKAVASESSATFFSISASSLTSKWVGEGEKLMRALFGVAKTRQPSVIFIDEIDSIMSTRSSNEHEASRRLKSEFLVQFDGVMSNDNDHIIVMGATNRPQELDDAVRRRLVKRIYVSLPDIDTRRNLLSKLLKGKAYSLPGSAIEDIARDTEGYSGSDLHALCQEAALIPIRELGALVNTVRADQVRSLTYMDFQLAMRVIRPSVSMDQLQQFEVWNQEFGSN